jgi:sugar lactone lactonase YvrE
VFTGVAGSASNQLNAPMGISLDPTSGTLYIVDSTNNRVMTASGTLAAGGNGGGNTKTQLLNPRGVYFDSTSNSLIIANYGGHNVVRWVLGATNWTLLAGSATGMPGSSSTDLNYPTDVILDSSGNLYVADTYNSRIQFYQPGQSNGTTIVGVTNTIGSTATLLHYPYSMRLDAQLNLYVLDSYNQRVQKFARL